MPGVERHFFEFEAFRLEVEDRRLTRNGEVLTLTPRDFDILLTLVQNAGQTVEKESLMDAVWQDTFVEEGNLNRHVSTVRRILGDDPREQRFIKTIPKRGYRFTAKVTETTESSERLEVDSVRRGRLVIREETIESSWTGKRAALATLLVIATASLAAWAYWDRQANARTHEVEASYARARHLWEKRTPDALHESILLLEHVVAVDPQFARGHAALADAYAFDYRYWHKAEDAAKRAIQIDPMLGEPHASIGFVRMFWEWRLADAEEEFKKAIELSPNYGTAHQWFALNLAATSHVDAALQEIEKASTLDPASIPIKADRCQILYYAEKFDSAIGQCSAVLNIDPTNTAANELLYQIYMSAGMHEQAVAKFVENLSISKSERHHALAGRFRDAFTTGGMTAFRDMQVDFYSETDRSGYKLARVLAEQGNHEQAITALENAVVKRDFDLVFFAPDPAFHAIRTNPQLGPIKGLPLK